MLLKRLSNVLQKLEDGLLVGLFLAMMLMTVLQIFLRNVSGTGIIWGDTMIRIVVLWAGLLGAMVATRQNNHITIDILTRYLSSRSKAAVHSVTLFFTGLLCLLTGYYSFQFVLTEREFQSIAFAQIPSWICQAIIPFAFFTIAFRCFVLSLTLINSILNPEP